MQQSINLLFKIHILVGVAPVVWFVVANTVIEELASRKYSKKILMKCALSNLIKSCCWKNDFLQKIKYVRSIYFISIIYITLTALKRIDSIFNPFCLLKHIVARGGCKGKSYFELQAWIGINFSNVNITLYLPEISF